eukprot:s1445_g12.t3
MLACYWKLFGGKPHSPAAQNGPRLCQRKNVFPLRAKLPAKTDGRRSRPKGHLKLRAQVMFDFDDLERAIEAKVEAVPAVPAVPAPVRAKVKHIKNNHTKVVRIWAISDLHTDDHHNKEWLDELETKGAANDVLIVAGDISHKWDIIKDTLGFLKARYARVFYCPGNHELWGNAQEDSMRRFHAILQLCEQLGVETAPAEVAVGDRCVLIVPIMSWHHPQWDVEPEIQGWRGLLPVDQMLSDYPLTHWPEGICIQDGSAALAIDKVNDELADWIDLLQRRHEYQEVLSFSHFLPRVENNPEKRYLTYPNLAKGIGSDYLRKRVEDLRPDIHVFGHTHFGYDLEVEGIRYVQAPLSMSSERHSRGTTVALGDFPDGLPFSHPFMVWHSRSGWAPKSQGAWSAYVERYGRRPDVTWLVPSYVADSGLEPITSSTGKKPKVGWLPGRAPVWLFGPKSQRILEAAAECRKVSERLAKEAAGTYKKNKKLHSDEPLPIEASEVAVLLHKGTVAVIDVREGHLDAWPDGAVHLPHPSQTSHFAALPDEELIPLGEQIMAGEGPRILVGSADAPASCRHAALLLAALLRLWPRRPPWRALVIALLGLNCRLFSTSTHHSTWQQRFQRIQGHRYTEQVLDLRHGPRDPRRLRLLRELLSPKEVGDLLALALSSDVDSKQEILGNPVKTPCQVLARDGAWTQGPLSDFFRPILEQRLLPYMKLALGCATLAPAQVLVRHYGAGVPRSFPAHSDHLAFGTAVLDLTPVTWSNWSCWEDHLSASVTI